MKEQIDSIQSEALAAIAAADNERALDDARVAVLGKKGTLTLASAGIKDVPKEDKAAVGQLLNAARSSSQLAAAGRRWQAPAGLGRRWPARAAAGRRRL